MKRSEAIKKFRLSVTMIRELSEAGGRRVMPTNTQTALIERGLVDPKECDAFSENVELTELGKEVRAALRGELSLQETPQEPVKSPSDRFHVTYQRHYHLKFGDRRSDSEVLSSRETLPEGFTREKAWEWVRVLRKTNNCGLLCVSSIKVWKVDPSKLNELGQKVWEWKAE